MTVKEFLQTNTSRCNVRIYLSEFPNMEALKENEDREIESWYACFDMQDIDTIQIWLKLKK